MAIEIKKKERKYFSPEFSVESWPETEKALRLLLDTEVTSAEGLAALIEKSGELSDILEEAGTWKMIRMTQHADDSRLSKEQADFYESIIAPSQPYLFQLDKKIYESEFFKALPGERYAQLGKLIRNKIELFREENVPLFVKENELAGRYGEIYSKLTVQFEGQERTLKEMELVLLDKDRARREAAWRAVWGKMLEKKDEFEQLFDELKGLRIRIAKNAGFGNYRDYMHKARGRFDYTPEDIYRFHEAVEASVVPLLEEINEERRQKLGVDTLRPWDLAVDADGRTLKPFSDTDGLLSGALRVLSRVDPEFSEIIRALSEKGLLDLPNRKGKAPGGYCTSLFETGGSFIFMNAVGIQYDVQTLLHESGHSIHSYFKKEEKISEYKDTPSEVAELASMSMELMTVEHYGEFYGNPEDLRKAKRELLEGTLTLLPLVAVVDAFQHGAYLHPESSAVERDGEYARLKERFNAGVDWTGLEKEKEIGWLKTMHIFELPFYYIEYGLAQLGAIALYKQYKQDPEKAVFRYKESMKLGYSKPVPEIYATAGIRFDFSAEHLREMAAFIVDELAKLEGASSARS